MEIQNLFVLGKFLKSFAKQKWVSNDNQRLRDEDLTTWIENENRLDFHSTSIQFNQFQEQEIKIESVCLLHENGVRLFSLQSRLRPEMFTDFLNHTKNRLKKCQISRFPKGHLNFDFFFLPKSHKSNSHHRSFFISWRVNHVKMMQKDRIGLNSCTNPIFAPGRCQRW